MARPAEPAATAGLLRSVAAGAVASIWTVFNAVALAGLIFAGPLAPALPTGIFALLASAAVVAVFVALGSRLRGMAATFASPTVPIYAAAVAAFDAHVTQRGMTDPGLRGEAALLACGLLTAITGAALLAAGAMRAGGLVRLLPYPVIAGYYVGLGWLFLGGGLSLAAGRPLGIADLRALPVATLWQLAAAAGVAACLLIAQRRALHWSIVPGVLLFGGIGFHAIRLWAGMSVPLARAAGWLLGPFPMGGLAEFLPSTPLESGLWRLLDGQGLLLMLPYAASTALLAFMSLMMWINGNEIDSRLTLPLNREITLAGVANLAGGLFGGIISGQSHSTTTILRQQNAMTRLAALIPAAAAAAVAVAGPEVLGLVPRFVCAALLLATGLDRLVLRPAADLPSLPWREAASVAAVGGVVIWAGMVTGVLAGLGLALATFALAYAGTPVIRVAFSGAECRSTVVRSAGEQAALMRHGDAILLCRLQGHMFFLNVGAIPATLAQRPPGALRHLILDFRDVTGIDSSVHTAFQRLRQVAVDQGFAIILCGMRPAVDRQFRRRGLLRAPLPGVATAETADAALRRAEAAVLRECGGTAPVAAWQLGDQLARLGGVEVIEARLAPYLVPVRLASGETLVRQGDAAEAMYFITAGTIATQIAAANGPALRLNTAGAGTVIGEVGMLCTGIRTASVVAETACEALALSRESLARMEHEDPALGTLLHRYLLLELAGKLADSTRLIEMQAM